MRSARSIIRFADSGLDFHDWYSKAWQELQAHENPGLVADYLALTSPRCHLIKNVRFTRHLLTTGKIPSGILPNVAASIRHYWKTGIIRGPKTSAFASALRGCPDSLVLDTWMGKAFDIPQKLLFRSDILERIRRIVANCADTLRLTIASTQAAIWAGTVRAHGRQAKYFPISLLFEG